MSQDGNEGRDMHRWLVDEQPQVSSQVPGEQPQVSVHDKMPDTLQSHKPNPISPTAISPKHIHIHRIICNKKKGRWVTKTVQNSKF